jgi:hypothetical protein
MKLYKVTHKHYSGLQTVSIVAANADKALVGARFVLKKKYSQGDEIVSVEKVQDIDRIER